MKYLLTIVFFFILNDLYSQSTAYANIFVTIVEAPVTVTSNNLKIENADYKIKLTNNISNNITYIKFTPIDIKYSGACKDSLSLNNQRLVKVINIE